MVRTRVSLLGIDSSDLLLSLRDLDLPCMGTAAMIGVQGRNGP